jgi:hypothetical protein
MPHTPQTVATIGVGVAVFVLVVVVLFAWFRTRSLIYPVVVISGAIAALNEPIADVLGLVWHRGPGQWNVFTTFGRPIPLWAVFAYPLYFGGGTCLVLLVLRHGVTRRGLWTGFLGVCAIDVLLEIPILHSNLYVYYGYQPFKVFGLPLIWLFINAIGCLIAAVAIRLGENYLRGGLRPLFILPLVPAAQIAALATGLLAFCTLNTDLTGFIPWLSTAVTLVFGSVVVDVVARFAGSGRLVPLGTVPASATPDAQAIAFADRNGPGLAGVRSSFLK